jgi:hypothetical protein
MSFSTENFSTGCGAPGYLAVPAAPLSARQNAALASRKLRMSNAGCFAAIDLLISTRQIFPIVISQRSDQHFSASPISGHRREIIGCQIAAARPRTYRRLL